MILLDMIKSITRAIIQIVGKKKNKKDTTTRVNMNTSMPTTRCLAKFYPILVRLYDSTSSCKHFQTSDAIKSSGKLVFVLKRDVNI